DGRDAQEHPYIFRQRRHTLPDAVSHIPRQSVVSGVALALTQRLSATHEEERYTSCPLQHPRTQSSWDPLRCLVDAVQETIEQLPGLFGRKGCERMVGS